MGDLCSDRHGDGPLPPSSPQRGVCGRGRSVGKGAGYQPSIRLVKKKQKKTILLDLMWKDEQNAAGPSDFCPRLGQLRKLHNAHLETG